MRGSFGADSDVCWRGGARGALGASSYPGEPHFAKKI